MSGELSSTSGSGFIKEPVGTPKPPSVTKREKGLPVSFSLAQGPDLFTPHEAPDIKIVYQKPNSKKDLI